MFRATAFNSGANSRGFLDPSFAFWQIGSTTVLPFRDVHVDFLWRGNWDSAPPIPVLAFPQ